MSPSAGRAERAGSPVHRRGGGVDDGQGLCDERVDPAGPLGGGGTRGVAEDPVGRDGPQTAGSQGGQQVRDRRGHAGFGTVGPDEFRVQVQQTPPPQPRAPQNVTYEKPDAPVGAPSNALPGGTAPASTNGGGSVSSTYNGAAGGAVSSSAAFARPSTHRPATPTPPASNPFPQRRPAPVTPAAPMTAASAAQPDVANAKVGRNDPCPCGSGKKFKHCHGREVGAVSGD